MTFEYAKKNLLEKMDVVLAEIRLLCSEPDLCNPVWRRLLEEKERLDNIIVKICNLNAAEIEAGRKVGE